MFHSGKFHYMELLTNEIFLCILWHVDPLLDNDRETNDFYRYGMHSTALKKIKYRFIIFKRNCLERRIGNI
jgi:hypothetical protein